MGTTKKLHDNSTSLCLIVILHIPNCGILELLYVSNVTLIMYFLNCVIGLLYMEF